MSVTPAASVSTHKFSYKWNLTDLEKVPKNGKKVFSCFSCGGGSTMGYKLAGYTVLGCCEIDPEMIDLYKTNHHPMFPYNEDIRDFNKRAVLPAELCDLDILDGSPPCSSFSTNGHMDKDWGKEKAFREGQKKQRLDDLFFYFLDTVEMLKPKVVIAENVKGLILGKARGYVHEIVKRFDAIGYTGQIFLLNAATMGVPQRRERVFFVFHRKDLDFPKLVLNFNESPIPFGEVRTVTGNGKPGGRIGAVLEQRRNGEARIADVNNRLFGSQSSYSLKIDDDEDVACTQTTTRKFRGCDKEYFSDLDIIHTQTFPEDYDFKGKDAAYVCGMSVPPVMMAQISSEVYSQWLARL